MLDFSDVLATPGVNIQSFFGDSDAATNLTDWKTWIKPRGIKWVYMIGVGGGSSGAGGTFTGASAASTGAVGGGSGAQASVLLPAFLVPSILYIQTGVGGRQGTAITSALASVNGTPTYVSVEPFTTLTPNCCFITANGGTGTTGGTVSVIANMPLAGRGVYSFFAGQNGGTAGATQSGAGGSVNAPTTGLMVTGGAGSGGKDVTAATRGAAGGVTGAGFLGTFPTIAGGATSASGVNAGTGVSGYMVTPYLFYGGTAGGSGGFAATNPGADGGAGGNGAPGCGGGASGPGYATTGRAGNGGDGFVYIISW